MLWVPCQRGELRIGGAGRVFPRVSIPVQLCVVPNPRVSDLGVHPIPKLGGRRTRRVANGQPNAKLHSSGILKARQNDGVNLLRCEDGALLFSNAA